MMATDNRQPAADRTASPWRNGSPPTQLEIIEEELISRVLRGTDGAPGPIAAAQQALMGEEESSSDGLGDISNRRHSLSSSMKRMSSNRSFAVYLKSGDEEQEGGWRTRTLPNMPRHDARNLDVQPEAPERQACIPKSPNPKTPGLAMENGFLYIPRRQSSRAQAGLGPPPQSLDERIAANRNSILRSPLASQPEIITITPDSERGGEELTTQVRRRSYVDASLRSVIRPSKSVRNSLDDDNDSSGTDRKSTPSPANAVRLTLEPNPRSNHIRANSQSSISSNTSRTAALSSTGRGTGARAPPRSLHDYEHHRYSLDLGHPSPLRSAPVHILPGSSERPEAVQPTGLRPTSLYGDLAERAHVTGNYLADAPEIIQQQSIAKSIGSSNIGASRLPDFFSRQVFQIALHNPATAHHLLKFSETRLCSENVEFLFKVEQYNAKLNELADIMAGIHRTYMAPESPNPLNVPPRMSREVRQKMKTIVMTSLPSMETVFVEMKALVEQLVFTDIYPRFVNHQLALNATKALAKDRTKFQGLGDCFCLTNPSKVDNPIVFASDGLLKVTGYNRHEIISRNCRFLQGKLTDAAPVHRLAKAVDERSESVELLLNYKKNGDPFWNLLYIAPLIDEAGEVAFWLGGQVNCSSTIHDSADIMKILSTSTAGEADRDPGSQTGTSQGRTSLPRTLMKAFGLLNGDSKTASHSAGYDTGMEKDVLGRMEGHDLPTQMKEFYTAYSKYMVLRADSFAVAFYSAGVTDVLHPNNTGGRIVGQDIFRFLKQNMISQQSDYKARVRSAVRGGHPASVEIRLQTRRSARFRGDESFVAHWTPLKDERALVQWIVVTLVPTMA